MKSRKQEIIQLAVALIETRGVQGFSYNDISKQLDITKASIHYHFPNKSDLVLAVIASYREKLEHVVKKIEQIADQKERLITFFKANKAMLTENHICAIYALEMSYGVLDVTIQEAVRAFMNEERVYIAQLLSAFDQVHNQDEANFLLSLFKGSIVHARIDSSIDVIELIRMRVLTYAS